MARKEKDMEDRLAAALRENLRRRKAQARAFQGVVPAQAGTSGQGGDGDRKR